MGTEKPIRVAVYTGTERPFATNTGVGKHVENLVFDLATAPDFNVTYYVPKDRWRQDQSCTPCSKGSAISSIAMPITRKWHLARSLGPRPPPFEDYAPAVDWVYAPMELYCPTRTAKFAVTIHDVYHFEPWKRTRLNPRDCLSFFRWSKAIGHATVIFTVSQFTKERIRDIFDAKGEKIVVVGNGVDPIFFEMAAENPEIASPLGVKQYYLSIGSISRKKGGAYLLQFAKLLERVSPSRYLVVIGPVELEFQSQIATQRNLLVIGRGGTDITIARWVRGAVAMLCFSEYEGFGIPAAEAMAAGVPVVANSQGALMEVLGGAGMIIDVRSPLDLERALLVAKDPVLRDRLINLGLSRAEYFRWGRCSAALMTYLRANT